MIDSAQAMTDSAQADIHDRLICVTEERNGLVDQVASMARQIAALKAELTKQREDSPKMVEARGVFDYWVDKLGKTKRTTFGPKRQKAVIARLNERALSDSEDRKDDLLLAVQGLARKPFVGPKGRQADDGPGCAKCDELEIAMRDETAVERFMGYALEECEVVPIRGVPQEIAELYARGELQPLLARCECGHAKASHTYPLQPLWCPESMVGWQPCTAAGCSCMDFDGLRVAA